MQNYIAIKELHRTNKNFVEYFLNNSNEYFTPEEMVVKEYAPSE